jgi:hypothetical protein
VTKPQLAMSCHADGARAFSTRGTPAASAALTSVMFYPAYNQTVSRNSMARLDFGVEVGMERFGAVHTDAAPINRLELC